MVQVSGSRMRFLPVKKPRINLKMKRHRPSSLALLTSLLGIIVMQFLPWMKGSAKPFKYCITNHKSECQRLVVILSFLWQRHSGGAFQIQWDYEWSYWAVGNVGKQLPYSGSERIVQHSSFAGIHLKFFYFSLFVLPTVDSPCMKWTQISQGIWKYTSREQFVENCHSVWEKQRRSRKVVYSVLSKDIREDTGAMPLVLSSKCVQLPLVLTSWPALEEQGPLLLFSTTLESH